MKEEIQKFTENISCCLGIVIIFLIVVIAILPFLILTGVLSNP